LAGKLRIWRQVGEVWGERGKRMKKKKGGLHGGQAKKSANKGGGGEVAGGGVGQLGQTDLKRLSEKRGKSAGGKKFISGTLGCGPFTGVTTKRGERQFAAGRGFRGGGSNGGKRKGRRKVVGKQTLPWEENARNRTYCFAEKWRGELRVKVVTKCRKRKGGSGKGVLINRSSDAKSGEKGNKCRSHPNEIRTLRLS